MSIYKIHSGILKIIVFIAYTILWILAIISILYIASLLWGSAVLGIFELDGWKMFYVIPGSIILIIISVKIAIIFIKYLIENFFKTLTVETFVQAIVATGIAAACIIPIIVIIVIGWPLVLWLIISDWKERYSKQEIIDKILKFLNW